MKNIKKLLAITLAVCMLIGMPLSIHVGAVGTSDDEPLRVIALLIPDYIGTATGYTASKTIHLYFNKNVTIGNNFDNNLDNDTVGARVAAIYDDGLALTESHAMSKITPASGKFGTTNHYIVQHCSNSQPAYTTLASMASTKNLTLVVRLNDKGDTTTKDGKIDNVKVNGNAIDSNKVAPLTCGNSGLVNIDAEKNIRDCLDIPVMTIDDMLTMKSAKWVDEDTISVGFSQPGQVRRSNGTNTDAYFGIRILNSENKLMYYNPSNAEGNKYTTSGSGTYDFLQAAAIPDTNTFDILTTQKSNVQVGDILAGSQKTMTWFMTHLEACRAEHPNETFTLSYVVEAQESTAGKIHKNRGEAENNWYISAYYTETGLPLMATHNSMTGLYADTAIVPFTLDEGAITINGVSFDNVSAISKAPAGSEITLTDDIAVNAGDALIVPAEVTFNLNGKTVTLAEGAKLNAYGNIEDTTDGNALIKVANKDDIMVLNSEQMALYDDAEEGGYRLFHNNYEAKGVKGGTKEDPDNTNAKRYGIHLHFDNKKAYELLVTGESEVVLTMHLYTESKRLDVPAYTITEATIKKYAQACVDAQNDTDLARKTIVLTVIGLNKLNGEALHVESTLWSRTITEIDTVTISE